MTPPASAFLVPPLSTAFKPSRRGPRASGELAVTDRLAAPGGGGPTGNIEQAHTAWHEGVRERVAPACRRFALVVHV
jgi:hypothetical protein